LKPPEKSPILARRAVDFVAEGLTGRDQLRSIHHPDTSVTTCAFGSDLAEVRFGILVVALFGAVLVVAARAVVLFDFAFLDDFFVVGAFFFVVGAFFVEAFFLARRLPASPSRLWGFLVRFLAAPIAAPERAPITVPTTGTPRAVPATAPATAPPSVLPTVPFSVLAASSSFFLSSMFSLLSWQ
jgi:hypothetical protein